MNENPKNTFLFLRECIEITIKKSIQQNTSLKCGIDPGSPLIDNAETPNDQKTTFLFIKLNSARYI